MSASAPGFKFQKDLLLADGQSHEVLLQPEGMTVSGRFFRPDGTPMTARTMFRRRGASPWLGGTPFAEEYFISGLIPGDYDFFIHPASMASARRIEMQTVSTLEAHGGQDDSLTKDVYFVAEVGGRLEAPGCSERALAEIFAVPAEFSIEALRADAPPLYTASSYDFDGAGDFRLYFLKEGIYKLAAGWPWSEGGFLQPLGSIEIKKGMIQEELLLTVPCAAY